MGGKATVTNSTITQCEFINNIAGWSGGAVYTSGNYRLQLNECQFTSNTAARGSGGAVYTSGNN